MDGVVHPESKGHLLEYVRSLWYRSSLGNVVRDFPWSFRECFSTLPNLHNFELNGVRVERVREEEFRACFSAFRETLTHLSLVFFSTSSSTFMILINCFPGITTLRLCSPELEPDYGPVPSLSLSLRGKVCIQDFGGRANGSKFLNRFAKLDLGYEESSIGPLFTETRFLESALQISTNTLKFLRLAVEF